MLGPSQLDLARNVAAERTEAMLADRAARSLSGPRTVLRERLGMSLVRTGMRMIGTVDGRARPQPSP